VVERRLIWIVGIKQNVWRRYWGIFFFIYGTYHSRRVTMTISPVDIMVKFPKLIVIVLTSDILF
jgi:hypothetical protein